MSNTLVTGLWDIGRGELSEGWSRPFELYLQKFEELLSIDENMIIFGDEKLREFVFKKTPYKVCFLSLARSKYHFSQSTLVFF